MPPRCAVCKDMASVFEGGILSHKMTTLLILLRRRFLVQIRPIFKWSFRMRRPSPFTAKIRQKYRRSPAPPSKKSPKNFWKGDDICHIFCAIIEAKEDTHARNQSL